ncbi:hypothetical protein R3P38DRAFT_3164771 [Favolaschia claudopus]|uniref:Uncharacterized protein n=1 Tax=Favolaschia claudopus TaxID=2862362 RepID=A0AAW0EI76_9AGAR
MAKTSMKRKRSSSPSKTKASPKARKRARQNQEVVEISDGSDEDDLESILALIKESEEKERRAQNVAGSSRSSELIDVDGEVEDDAAMARRLAAEWGTLEPEPTQPSAKNVSETVDVDDWKSPTTTSGTLAKSRDFSETDHLPPDERLAEYRTLFTSERDCSNCGKPIKSPRGYVRNVLLCDNYGGPTAIFDYAFTCVLFVLRHKSLQRMFCSSRMSQIMQGPCKERRLHSRNVLFRFPRLGPDSRALLLAQQQQHKTASVGPGGTGYGTDGRGDYASNSRSRGKGKGKGRGGNPAKVSQTAEMASHWDDIIVRVLNTLTSLLPSPYADSAQVYDMLPHPSIGHLLALSQLSELLASLLRNDSVSDWITRSEVYYAMIGLLRRMADCELTVEVLITSRFSIDKSSGLEEWMWEDGEIAWQKDKQGRIERGPALYDHFKKLTRQCEAFLAGAQHMMSEK